MGDGVVLYICTCKKHSTQLWVVGASWS